MGPSPKAETDETVSRCLKAETLPAFQARPARPVAVVLVPRNKPDRWRGGKAPEQLGFSTGSLV